MNLFQSTHPRGVRRSSGGSIGPLLWFQSTHPRGVRQQRNGLKINLAGVSIHAPARGATAWPAGQKLASPEFQSTHPRGVRRARPVAG
ncbi:hypothetical protein S1OALGB6SA_988 [Olavius algarvensis spirochete endosymbiont]|nr:hypothetical protein S1OALGB6SA_988 [Olavius algarvensis spirochete endosymbiont]